MTVRFTQVASSVPFDPTGLPAFTGTETSIQDALNVLGAQTFGEQTQFDGFSSTTLTQTTSTTFQINVTFTTPDTKPTGRYYIGWTNEYGQSDKDKRVETSPQYRVGTTGSWITLSTIAWTVGFDNTYGLECGFKIVDVTTEDVVQIRFRVRAAGDGGTARLRNANAIIYKVDELP